jgi:hypothetical protein
MEAICSSETSVDFQGTAQRYVPEDSTLFNLYLTAMKVLYYAIFYLWYVSQKNLCAF